MTDHRYAEKRSTTFADKKATLHVVDAAAPRDADGAHRTLCGRTMRVATRGAATDPAMVSCNRCRAAFATVAAR